MNGDSWRWNPRRHAHTGASTIAVIEPAEPRPDPPAGARLVPFGFSRALEDSDCIESKHADGWAEHAAMVIGTNEGS